MCDKDPDRHSPSRSRGPEPEPEPVRWRSPAWLAIAMLAACGHGDSDPSDVCTPAALDWGGPKTTLTERVVVDPVLAAPTTYDPASPEGLAAAEAAGLGTWHLEAGEPRLVRDELAPGHVPGQRRRSLALFVHHTDAQIADTESPVRMAGSDAPAETQSALRPQELYGIHALDALIREADLIDAEVSIDFALITGDNADNVQGNELQWFANVWDGVPGKTAWPTANEQVLKDVVSGCVGDVYGSRGWTGSLEVSSCPTPRRRTR